MTDIELQHDYLTCTECNHSNAVTVYDMFRTPIAYTTFNTSHEDVWMCNDDEDWYCPKHAHITTNMDRDEFEMYRDQGVVNFTSNPYIDDQSDPDAKKTINMSRLYTDP